MALMATARMMLDFAKGNVGITEIPPDMPKLQSAMARTAITLTTIAKMDVQLVEPPELNQQYTNTQTMLDKIKAKNTAPAKVAHEEHKTKLNAVEKVKVETDTKRATIDSQFKTAKQAVIDELKAIFATVKTSKNMDDAAGNQSVLNVIKSTRSKLSPFNVSITNLNKSTTKIIDELSQIQKTAIGHLSLDEQKVYKEAAAKKETPGAAPV